MKRSFQKKTIAAITAVVMLAGLSACGSKDKDKDKTANESKTTSESTTETTPTSTTATSSSIPVHSGPVNNDVQVTWTETQFETEKTVYCNASDGYVNVRKGPNSDSYDVVGKVNKGESVKVIAQTDNGWYKTSDGYYISAQFFTESAPA